MAAHLWVFSLNTLNRNRILRGFFQTSKRILNTTSFKFCIFTSKMGKGKQLLESDCKVIEPCVIVHGGAWSVPEELREISLEGVQQAAVAGYEAMLKGGNAVDGVEAAVRSLEDNPIFNAGHGSVLTEDGTVEMDAMIMDGKTLNTGAVAGVSHVPNPITLSRHVMEKTPHCLMIGNGAHKFAKKQNIPMIEDPTTLITNFSMLKSKYLKENEGPIDFNLMLKATMNTESLKNAKNPNAMKEFLTKQLKHDTVGAVAMDRHGNIACATSTGGIPGKMVGRVGDSPMVGSGGYANPFAGVSTTGHGESILKVVLAHEITKHVENGCPPSESCSKALSKMFDLTSGQGGAICIDKNGDYGKAFTTECMSWAAVKGGTLNYGLSAGESFKHEKKIELV